MIVSFSGLTYIPVPLLLAREVFEQMPEATRVKPQLGETWNEQLRISQQQVQEQPNRQAQQKQKSIGGGGMEL